jgi:hypothetical protein
VIHEWLHLDELVQLMEANMYNVSKLMCIGS